MSNKKTNIDIHSFEHDASTISTGPTLKCHHAFQIYLICGKKRLKIETLYNAKKKTTINRQRTTDRKQKKTTILTETDRNQKKG